MYLGIGLAFGFSVFKPEFLSGNAEVWKLNTELQKLKVEGLKPISVIVADIADIVQDI